MAVVVAMATVATRSHSKTPSILHQRSLRREVSRGPSDIEDRVSGVSSHEKKMCFGLQWTTLWHSPKMMWDVCRHPKEWTPLVEIKRVKRNFYFCGRKTN